MWSDNEHLNTQKVLSEQESTRTVGEERKGRGPKLKRMPSQKLTTTILLLVTGNVAWVLSDECELVSVWQ